MSKRDRWVDGGGLGVSNSYCNEHEHSFTDICPDCFVELEEENERLKLDEDNRADKWDELTKKVNEAEDSIQELVELRKWRENLSKNQVDFIIKICKLQRIYEHYKTIQELEKELQNSNTRFNNMLDERDIRIGQYQKLVKDLKAMKVYDSDFKEDALIRLNTIIKMFEKETSP